MCARDQRKEQKSTKMMMKHQYYPKSQEYTQENKPCRRIKEHRRGDNMTRDDLDTDKK